MDNTSTKRTADDVSGTKDSKIARVISNDGPSKENSVENSQAAKIPPSVSDSAPKQPPAAVDFTQLLQSHGHQVTSTSTQVPPTVPITSTSSAPTSAAPSTVTPSTDVIDIPSLLNLHSGSKILVMWELEQGPGLPLKRHWWPATLLPWDERVYLMEDEETGDSQSVPLRLINYEPSEELGYPEETLSECAFLGDHLVFDLGENNTTMFKREGEFWEPSDVDLEEAPVQAPVSNFGREEVGTGGGGGEAIVFDRSREGMERFLNDLLADAFANVSSRMTNLTPAKQHMVAEVINKSKQTILESMLKKLEGVEEVTREHINAIMEDVGEAIGRIREEAKEA
ncbi:hypothetical protein TL16_g06848 [Triparma laevis f. inornata]|uniref:Uncharacterized protein n=1 Tax=Triparma laevis f. inornata TaxID=1714386 RepID=A0A9W7AXG6_9STRA|nr:hypothetical protein TL16_g06848 [Triparma laevis f. inornata]